MCVCVCVCVGCVWEAVCVCVWGGGHVSNDLHCRWSYNKCTKVVKIRREIMCMYTMYKPSLVYQPSHCELVIPLLHHFSRCVP